LISFRWTFSCLLKDHAVAASRHDATLLAEVVVHHVRGLNPPSRTADTARRPAGWRSAQSSTPSQDRSGVATTARTQATACGTAPGSRLVSASDRRKRMRTRDRRHCRAAAGRSRCRMRPGPDGPGWRPRSPGRGAAPNRIRSGRPAPRGDPPANRRVTVEAMTGGALARLCGRGSGTR